VCCVVVIGLTHVESSCFDFVEMSVMLSFYLQFGSKQLQDIVRSEAPLVGCVVRSTFVWILWMRSVVEFW